MQPREVQTVEDARAIVSERGLNHVKIGIIDADGILRGKYISRSKFEAALEKGIGFCDVVLGWDSADQLYDCASITGWHTGYPDASLRLLPETCRDIPFEDGMLFFLSEFAGAAEECCPRGMLRRVLRKAEDMGYRSLAALEYEFFLFNETPRSVREKNYKGLEPITPGYFGYSVLRNSVNAELCHEILQISEDMDFPLEGLHTETGPGVLEAAIAVDEGLLAADKAALFKTFVKVYAQRRDLMATFMAKWSPDWPGQSGHIHLSLREAGSDRPVFHEEGAPGNMSRVHRHFLGGQQQLMPELTVMFAQTINSYRRLIPGYWAPTDATWGMDNRTCAIRVIGGGEGSQRNEYRLPSADANPYIAIAAAIGSGLWGIEHGIEPGDPVEGSAYEKDQPAERALPRTLFDAADRLLASEAASALFGDAFVGHYAASRQWEAREFRKHISDWEMERYFEII